MCFARRYSTAITPTPVVAFGALWVENWPANGKWLKLLKFSENDLRVSQQISVSPYDYGLVPLGSSFWSVSVEGLLERLDPVTGSVTSVPLSPLPPHATVSGIAAFGPSLVLSTIGPQATDSETVVYRPGAGITAPSARS